MNNYKGHSHQLFGQYTYSQHGEDLMLMNLCRLMKLEKPSFIDLGAYHPFHISNSALLYEHGSRGINVEANPLLLDAFRQKRPEDINLWMGVGTAPGNMLFYMESDNSVLNSFKESSCEQHNIKFKTSQWVPVITLNEIIDRYYEGKFPDILLTDIEDLDFDVLHTADFEKSKPKIILSEIRLHQSDLTKTMMRGQGFSYLCRISENHIFIQDEYYQYCV